MCRPGLIAGLILSSVCIDVLYGEHCLWPDYLKTVDLTLEIDPKVVELRLCRKTVRREV